MESISGIYEGMAMVMTKTNIASHLNITFPKNISYNIGIDKSISKELWKFGYPFDFQIDKDNFLTQDLPTSIY